MFFCFDAAPSLTRQVLMMRLAATLFPIHSFVSFVFVFWGEGGEVMLSVCVWRRWKLAIPKRGTRWMKNIKIEIGHNSAAIWLATVEDKMVMKSSRGWTLGVSPKIPFIGAFEASDSEKLLSINWYATQSVVRIGWPCCAPHPTATPLLVQQILFFIVLRNRIISLRGRHAKTGAHFPNSANAKYSNARRC